ncbi:N-acetylglucosamine-1-phosphate transferase subunits alpha and beta isoform X1 [Leptinotarsa decemlineata]|uniref:N-acetylglucosamine-1-phosphate transferase subunits alpha and beta isoform X1 n=1 Tax=Leptinotarsa decemlineata TaxID=7539 RepID=UPI003D30BFEC
MVILRLNKRISFFKLFLAVTFFIFMIIYFGLQKNKLECQLQEAVDVVYTWVNGSDPVFLQNLENYIEAESDLYDVSKQRFDDKEELKFSLRSLEKYAPWVNHVYIVTNGQIPSWLNLDYEKVTLVTHEEIFKDTFNLPTFSSPAIESNLHRISRLSKKFIYFNDDIFLGMPTYLEDFFTTGRGFLIYLAWPVPDCASNCPWIYVADGQCDEDCFLSQCQMDGGDCIDFNGKIHNFENETKNLVLADIINKVKSNFYQTFLKKLSPNQSLMNPRILLKNTSNIVNETKNIFDAVNRHNGLIMKKEKLVRTENRKRKTRYVSEPQANVQFDGYSASLQHTNRLFNSKYGFKSRKVPSHAPILIDKDIISDLQFTFAREFVITERNRVRRKDDMQFSFSYYYFVMSERENLTVDQIFDLFDTDHSSTWSDREIRTLLTKLYELPLSYASIDHFEELLRNCSQNGINPEVPTPPFERYIDSKLPTISKILVKSCISLTEILVQRFGTKSKYNYSIVPNSEKNNVFFAMINSNVSDVVRNLDDVRSNMRKFVCLNDNVDETKEDENELVKAILYDFYFSLFPHPSKFELPEDVRNKFSYINDLKDWKRYRNRVKILVFSVMSVIVCIIFYNFCKKKCCRIIKRLFC